MYFDYVSSIDPKSPVDIEQHLVDKELFKQLDEEALSSSKATDRSSKSAARLMKCEVQNQPNIKELVTSSDKINLVKSDDKQDLHDRYLAHKREKYLAIEKEADDSRQKWKEYEKDFELDKDTYFENNVIGGYDYAAEQAAEIGDWEYSSLLFQKCSEVCFQELDQDGAAGHYLEKALNYSLKDGTKIIDHLSTDAIKNIYEKMLVVSEKSYEKTKKELEQDDCEQVEFSQIKLANNLIIRAAVLEKLNRSEEEINSLYKEAIDYLTQNPEVIFELDFVFNFSSKFVAALCLEKVKDFDHANEIYKKVFEDFFNKVENFKQEYKILFDKLETLSDKEKKEDILNNFLWKTFYSEPPLRPLLEVIKVLSLKINNIDQFCEISEFEIEVMEKLIINLYQNEDLDSVDEFIEEANKNRKDYSHISLQAIRFSIFYFALCESYALKCDQMGMHEKSQETRSKIADMKACLKFDQLGDNFNNYFNTEVKNNLNVYMKLYSNPDVPVQEIIALFKNEYLIHP